MRWHEAGPVLAETGLAVELLKGPVPTWSLELATVVRLGPAD